MIRLNQSKKTGYRYSKLKDTVDKYKRQLAFLEERVYNT